MNHYNWIDIESTRLFFSKLFINYNYGRGSSRFICHTDFIRWGGTYSSLNFFFYYISISTSNKLFHKYPVLTVSHTFPFSISLPHSRQTLTFVQTQHRQHYITSHHSSPTFTHSNPLPKTTQHYITSHHSSPTFTHSYPLSKTLFVIHSHISPSNPSQN